MNNVSSNSSVPSKDCLCKKQKSHKYSFIHILQIIHIFVSKKLSLETVFEELQPNLVVLSEHKLKCEESKSTVILSCLVIVV